jgi:hypothetical protein
VKTKIKYKFGFPNFFSYPHDNPNYPMKVFVEHLLQQWAERCDGGEIDFNSAKKVQILHSLIQEIQLESELLDHTVTYKTVEEEYDAIIKQKFGYIPVPETKVLSLDLLNELALSANDREVMQALYPLKPTTKSGAKNNSGTGKGELSLYWLLSHSNFKVKINSKSNSNQPDFTVDEIGIEIKSFEDPNINLGRFQKSKDFGDLLELLNIAYTLSTVNEFMDPDKTVNYSTLSVNPKQLQPIFAQVCAMKQTLKLFNEGMFDHNLINAINKLSSIYESRAGKPMPEDDCDLTQFFISELIKTKLYTKLV